jgi:hypothetical protein
MAPILPNNTARFRVSYVVGGENHTFEVRSGASPSAVGTLVDHFLSSLGAAIGAMTINGVEFAAEGSDIFNAVTTGIEGNPYGTGAVTNAVRANAYNFIGRSPGGRRVRLMVFGAVDLGSDFRFVAGENAAIDSGIEALNDAGGNILCIDGLTPIWKTYANCIVNAHWQKQLRP